MKIVNLSGSKVTEGAPQPLPFDLGESGRGRTLVRVDISKAPGKTPVGPPLVGPEVPYAMELFAPGLYFYDSAKAAEYALQAAKCAAYVARQERERVAAAWPWDVDFLPGRPPQGGAVYLLKAGTAPGPKQRGVLVRLNTAGCYTKGSCGSYAVVHGEATVVAEGRWAEGDAGRVAGGPDVLLHVPGACLIRAVLQGGAGKGWGGRIVVVTKEGKAWMGTAAELAGLITSDERPDLTEVVRAYIEASKGAPPQDSGWGAKPGPIEWWQILADACTAADALEAAPPAEAAGIEHYYLYPIEDWSAFLASLTPKLTLPPGQKVPEGVDRVQAGCLMPGGCSMVILDVGPGGGKRYGYTAPQVNGVEVVGRKDGRGKEVVLGIVTDVEWSISWSESKDGEVIGRYIAGPDGVREMIGGELHPWA
jgi:hypothetical protein